jgi:hypothetical protein
LGVHEQPHDQSGSVPPTGNESPDVTAVVYVRIDVHGLRVILFCEFDDIGCAYRNSTGRGRFTHREVLEKAGSGHISLHSNVEASRIEPLSITALDLLIGIPSPSPKRHRGDNEHPLAGLHSLLDAPLILLLNDIDLNPDALLQPKANQIWNG